MRKLAVACASAGALLLASRSGSADQRSRIDSSDGRFDGDLGVVGGLGATFGPRGPRAALDARIRYLSTAGLFATYEDGPLLGSSAEPTRVIAFGLEVRPLFLARWGTGHELGIPRLDLALDSLGLELGAVFSQPAGARFGARAGLEAGLGLELPILPRASGPLVGLHAGARWSEAALAGGPLDGAADRALYVSVLVGWQALFGSPIIDFDDRLGAAR
jgi:hypothetical protein